MSDFTKAQLDEIATLVGAGLGPAGVIAELTLSPNFTHDELQKLGDGAGGSAGADSSGGSTGGGSGGDGQTKGKRKKGGGGGSGGIVQKLLPVIKHGDSNVSNASQGVGYNAPQLGQPTIIPGSGGGSPMEPILIGGVVIAVAIGAYFIFFKHKKGETK